MIIIITTVNSVRINNGNSSSCTICRGRSNSISISIRIRIRTYCSHYYVALVISVLLDMTEWNQIHAIFVLMIFIAHKIKNEYCVYCLSRYEGLFIRCSIWISPIIIHTHKFLVS